MFSSTKFSEEYFRCFFFHLNYERLVPALYLKLRERFIHLHIYLYNFVHVIYANWYTNVYKIYELWLHLNPNTRKSHNSFFQCGPSDARYREVWMFRTEYNMHIPSNILGKKHHNVIWDLKISQEVPNWKVSVK